MTLTTEQLRAIAEEELDACATLDAAKLMARELLANREAQPVGGGEFIPKNLDRALAVVGLAIPESREEFNFQTERWIQRLIDRVIRYSDEFPAPAVNAAPDFEAWFVEKYKQPERLIKNEDGTYKFSGVQMAFSAWNACRASNAGSSSGG